MNRAITCRGITWNRVLRWTLYAMVLGSIGLVLLETVEAKPRKNKRVDKQVYSNPIPKPFYDPRIDALVEAKAEAAGARVQPVCSDRVFLRRATIDLVGRIPTRSEIDRYFKDPENQRREMLVQRLMKDHRFNDRWAMFLGEMMLVRSERLHRHLAKTIREDRPWNQVVHDMLTATGRSRSDARTDLIAIPARNGGALGVASYVSQVFLGMRLGCAQCHNHPFDVWTQKQFYELASHFTTTKYERNLGAIIEVRGDPLLWPPNPAASDRKPLAPTWIFPDAKGDDKQLKKAVESAKAKRAPIIAARKAAEKKKALALAMDEAAKEDKFGGFADPKLEKQAKTFKDPRTVVAPDRVKAANDITNPEHRYFSRNMANRIWAELLGRGIVNPVDDLRQDNPPSHPELLDHLANSFVASDHSIKSLVQQIVLSKTYQRAQFAAVEGSQDNDARALAEKHFVAMPLRRMQAEVLHDSIALAGHLLNRVKHRPGQNMTPVMYEVREYYTVKEDGEKKEVSKSEAQKKNRMQRQAMGPDIDKALSDDPLLRDIYLERRLAMQGQSMQEVEVENNTDNMPAALRVAFKVKRVTRMVDRNPRFSAKLGTTRVGIDRMLNEFGQSSRRLLGEKRDDDRAGMRQALALLAGPLANQAARVGDLEPMGKLVGEGKPAEPAIELAYIEILSRKPNADEVKNAKQLIAASESMRIGIEDLRWVLLNSHEFRFLP